MEILNKNDVVRDYAMTQMNDKTVETRTIKGNRREDIVFDERDKLL